MPKKYTLRGVLTFIAPPVFVVSLVVAVILLIYASLIWKDNTEMLEESEYTRLYAAAGEARHLISEEELNEIKPYSAAAGNARKSVSEIKEFMLGDLYLNLQARVAAFAEERGFDFVYFYIPMTDRLKIRSCATIVDSDPDPLEQYNLLHEPIPISVEIEPNVVETYENKIISVNDLSVSSPGYEGYCSGFAPILNAAGEVIAIVGVDVSSENLITIHGTTTFLTVLLFVIIGLSMISGSLTYAVFIAGNASLTKKLAQSKIIAEIAKTLISTRSATERINSAVETAGRHIFADRATVFIYTPEDDNTFTPAYGWDKFKDPIAKYSTNFRADSVPFNRLPVREPDTAAEILSCNDTRGSEEFKPVYEMYGISSFLWLPVYLNGSLKAVLSFSDTSRAQHWTAADSDFALMFADILTHALAAEC